MCCFLLHFSDFNVLLKKNLLQFTIKKLVVQKREKKYLSQGKIPAPLEYQMVCLLLNRPTFHGFIKHDKYDSNP